MALGLCTCVGPSPQVVSSGTPSLAPVTTTVAAPVTTTATIPEPAAVPTPPAEEAPSYTRDACIGHALIRADDGERTLYWSCIGVAMDIPKGRDRRDGDQ